MHAERVAKKPGWPLKCHRSKQEEGEETAASCLLPAICMYIYRDSSRLSKGHNKALQRLLVLVIVMCGIPGKALSPASKQNKFVQSGMKHFLHCMRPSFDLPGIVLLLL
ncbi:TPA: hypothetical protein ACH3X1_005741 [Trebouxia sp. C0004]